MSAKTTRYQGVPLPEHSVIQRKITVAEGVYAPGHLGELTQLIPFEMVDEALSATATVQSRLRRLPSRVVVYLLLAAALFEGQGYGQVWRRLTAGLDGLRLAAPTEAALWQARARVGVRPLRWLFDLLRGPAAAIAAGGVRWCGLLVCALDGTMMTVPDTAANTTRFPKHRCNHGGSGYPLIRVMVLVCCGTRTVIDAVFGPTSVGETTYAYRLLRSLSPGMLLLADRNFGAAKLVAAVAATGADVLVRLKTGRQLPVLQRFADGSFLSLLDGVKVRVIDAEISIATISGRHTGVYRLVTTLLDHRRYKAFELVKLYHERWEVETCYLEVKSTILGGRVLRARTPTGIEQEVYALLIAYQLLRTAIADAAFAAGIDADRASFSIALHSARDQIIQAAGVLAGTVIDLIGTIGRHVLARPMPDRRVRISPRIVKRAISKYNARGTNINRTSYKATIGINILASAGP